MANIKSKFSSIDSIDLSETIRKGKPSKRKFIPYFVGSELRAFRYKDHKIHFITQGAYNMPPPRELHEKPLLYDLSKDIGESQDISEIDTKTLEIIIKSPNHNIVLLSNRLISLLYLTSSASTS